MRGPLLAFVSFAVVIGVFVGAGFLFGGRSQTPATDVTRPSPLPTPTPLTQEVSEPIEPGYYFIDADGDPSTSAGVTFLIKSQGWRGSKERVNFYDISGVSFHTLHMELFVEPFTPVCGDGPVDPGVPVAAGSTATDLADGFAASGFTVLEAPAPVTAFGQDGYHVVVQVPEGCQFGGERTQHRWIYPGDVMEIWSFEIDGSLVMIEALWLTRGPGMVVPAEDERLTALRGVIDSLELVSGESIEPTPTTLAPDPELTTDLEIIQAGVKALEILVAGVDAFYSGDSDRAARLFELVDRTDHEIRQESQFQAAIDGRLTLTCEPDGPGQLQCLVPYQNAPADAVGYRDSPGDSIRVVVENGEVTQFSFPWHTWLERDLSVFLSEFEDSQVCGQGGVGNPLLRTTDCASWIMEHLDEWAEWSNS
jgi:hypothetical protein